jgi:hypothetical protein
MEEWAKVLPEGNKTKKMIFQFLGEFIIDRLIESL